MRIERSGPIEKLTPKISRFLVEALGGVSLDEIQSQEQTRIDFSCLRGLLAIEIKSLEGDPSERINNLVDTLRNRPDFPFFFGAPPLDAAFQNMKEPEKLRHMALDRIGRTIVTHLKKANDQLGQHKKNFPRQRRVSIVVLINEDHPEYDPRTVIWLVQREFTREDERGPRYPHMDAVLYFTERHGQKIDGLVALPTVIIHGPNIEKEPWKGTVLDQVARRWAGWNGRPFRSIDDSSELGFESFDHVPDSLPRHELWRLKYRRRPYLRTLSSDKLRDRFDEIMLIIMLWGVKDSPVQVDKNSVMALMEQFTQIEVEMHHRALPVAAFKHEFSRQLAAAARLCLPQQAVDWLCELESSKHQNQN